jgi:hypothetical protein
MLRKLRSITRDGVKGQLASWWGELTAAGSAAGNSGATTATAPQCVFNGLSYMNGI